jgi:crotonobetainyl-CoA:carnitine CoA-transferase CaiB-like acyl-CoA transferase
MQILKNCKVIELATVLAGPSVGQFLAELGADVLKIENPNLGGDVTRSWKLASESADNTVSAYFSSVNWGKKSIALDVSQPENLAKVHELVKTADFVIANYKTGDAEKLKLSYKDLQVLNPQLIYGHITGYGLDYQKVGYDAVIQAEAGFVYINGEVAGKSVKMPVALIDLLAAHQLKEALLVAWIHKLQAAEGSYVTVSLFDSAVASLANQAANWLVAGVVPQRIGSEHPNIVPYGNIFETKDKAAILIAVGNDKQFKELCKILELPQLPLLDDFASNQQRVKNRIALVLLLESAFAKFDKAMLLAKFEEAKIPAGGVNTMQEVFENPLTKPLLLQATDSKEMQGVRNFVARFYQNGAWLDMPTLLPPPAL